MSTSVNKFTQRSSFDCMFAPLSVAVIGATDREGTVGSTLLQNLLRGGLPGEIYPINPKRESILSLHSYKSIGAVPDPLTSGSTVSVLQDNGDTVWYGDGLTSKTGIAQDFQKDLGESLVYSS